MKSDVRNISAAELSTLLETRTVQQVADHFDCGYRTVSRAIRDHGIRLIATPRDRVTAEDPKTINADCAQHGREEFVKTASSGGFRYRCRKCLRSYASASQRRHRDRTTERLTARRRELVLSRGSACELCGYSEWLGALQFHHLDAPSKLFALNVTAMARSQESIEAEARKCALLCTRCHIGVENGVLTLRGVRRDLARERFVAKAIRSRESDRHAVHACHHHGEVPHLRTASGRKCCDCTVEAVTRLRQRRRARLVEMHGGRCSACGFDEFVAGLQFHHLVPDEKCFSLSGAGLTKRWATVVEESAKCALLCSNCHAEVEHGHRASPPATLRLAD